MKKRLLFFILLFVVFLSPTFFCYAAGLEVEYPNLPNGVSGISGNVQLPEYFSYIFQAGMYIGFLSVFISLAVAGVFYILSPSAEAKATARDRLSGAISGFLILLFTYLIITTISPNLAIIRLTPLPEIPPAPPAPPINGVYLYKGGDCSDKNVPAVTSSIQDLADKNKINRIDFSQNPDTKTYYIAIIYDVINFWGKCQYINPNRRCVPVSPFAASASIYQYNFSPKGGGVTFYRKSFFDDKGGSLTIGPGQISNNYIGALKDLKFNNVPESEKPCVKWDKDGVCVKKETPTLEGENISSIKIDGDYIVILVYFNEKTDSGSGPWTFCQAFPTVNEVNKEGPRQIKWASIRNIGTPPNYVLIFPVVSK